VGGAKLRTALKNALWPRTWVNPLSLPLAWTRHGRIGTRDKTWSSTIWRDHAVKGFHGPASRAAA